MPQERLQKIIARAGVTSGRRGEELIVRGLVSVNGRVVTELGSKADTERDHIKVNGKLLTRSPSRVYLLLNKPTGYVSTLRDPEGRATVVSLLRGVRERVYPVGRLDYHSSGLMLLTNDGELANLLMARASAVPRTYHVKLEGHPEAGELEKLRRGIALDGQPTAPARIQALAGRDKPWYEVTLVEGRYHQARRMVERIGQEPLNLKQVRIALLTDQELTPGQFRILTPHEPRRLYANGR